MTREERTSQALDHIMAAKRAIYEADSDPDPVAQRKLDARAALHFRKAADLLDDEGRLAD